jgi:hypothetical protein
MTHLPRSFQIQIWLSLFSQSWCSLTSSVTRSFVMTEKFQPLRFRRAILCHLHRRRVRLYIPAYAQHYEYSEGPDTSMLNSSKSAQNQRGRSYALQPHNTPAVLQERDVCPKLAACLQNAVDSAITTKLFLADAIGSTWNNIADAI